MPARRTARTMRVQSSSVSAIGLSWITCSPAAHATSVSSAWREVAGLTHAACGRNREIARSTSSTNGTRSSAARARARASDHSGALGASATATSRNRGWPPAAVRAK